MAFPCGTVGRSFVHKKHRGPSELYLDKQIRMALFWLRAFLTFQEGSIVRTYTLQACRGGGTKVAMLTDACP